MGRLGQFLLGVFLVSFGVYGVGELAGVKWWIAAIAGVIGALLIITVDWVAHRKERRKV